MTFEEQHRQFIRLQMEVSDAETLLDIAKAKLEAFRLEWAPVKVGNIIRVSDHRGTSPYKVRVAKVRVSTTFPRLETGAWSRPRIEINLMLKNGQWSNFGRELYSGSYTLISSSDEATHE